MKSAEIIPYVGDLVIACTAFVHGSKLLVALFDKIAEITSNKFDDRVATFLVKLLDASSNGLEKANKYVGYFAVTKPASRR